VCSPFADASGQSNEIGERNSHGNAVHPRSQRASRRRSRLRPRPNRTGTSPLRRTTWLHNRRHWVGYVPAGQNRTTQMGDDRGDLHGPVPWPGFALPPRETSRRRYRNDLRRPRGHEVAPGRHRWGPDCQSASTTRACPHRGLGRASRPELWWVDVWWLDVCPGRRLNRSATRSVDDHVAARGANHCSVCCRPVVRPTANPLVRSSCYSRLAYRYAQTAR
jgi:hypothetical protein